MSQLTLKSLVLCTALLASTLLAWPVLAADNPNYRGNQESYDTFAGFGYKQYWVTPQGEWKKVLNGHTGGFGLFVGQRVHPYFAVELGYEWSNNPPKIVSVANGTTFLGIPNTVAGPGSINLQGKVRFTSGYADLQILMPMHLAETFNPELIVALGVGIMKAGLKFSTDMSEDALTANLNAANFVAPFSSILGKTKGVGRVGLGVQSFFTESIGMRALWRFENTAGLRGTNSPVARDPNTRRLFKNGQSVFVGLVMKL